jgi:adenine phosphoribosyltransferase
VSAVYELEYGRAALEIHTDATQRATRVLVHDDLLATGGTARALCDLVTGLGAEVLGCAFLVELSFLGGRGRLAPYEVNALIDFQAE